MAAAIEFDVNGKKGRAVLGRKGDTMCIAVALPNGYNFGFQTDLGKLEREAKAILMDRVGWDWESVQGEAKHIAREAGMAQLMRAAKCHAAEVGDAEVIGYDLVGANKIHHLRKARHVLSKRDAQLYKLAPMTLYQGRPDGYIQVQRGNLPFKIADHKGWYYNAKTGVLQIKAIKGLSLGGIKKLGRLAKAAGKAAGKFAVKAAPLAKMAAGALGVPPGLTDKITGLVNKAAEGNRAARRKLARLRRLAENNARARQLLQVAHAAARVRTVTGQPATADSPAVPSPAGTPTPGYVDHSRDGGGGGGGGGGDDDGELPARGFRPDEDTAAEETDSDREAKEESDEEIKVVDDASDDAAQPAADGGDDEGMSPIPDSAADADDGGGGSEEDAAEDVGGDLELVGADLELVGAEVAKKVTPAAMAKIRHHVRKARAGDKKSKAAIKSIMAKAKKGHPAARAALHAVNLAVAQEKAGAPMRPAMGPVSTGSQMVAVERFRHFFQLLGEVRAGRA